MVTKMLKIYGVVQGVGFRYSLCDVAIQAGAKGWVKNGKDGTVEVLVQGSDPQVQAVMDFAKKGPPAARIDKVDVTDGTGKYDDFEILPS